MGLCACGSEKTRPYFYRSVKVERCPAGKNTREGYSRAVCRALTLMYFYHSVLEGRFSIFTRF
jgi:hypothetical protein